MTKTIFLVKIYDVDISEEQMEKWMHDVLLPAYNIMPNFEVDKLQT